MSEVKTERQCAGNGGSCGATSAGRFEIAALGPSKLNEIVDVHCAAFSESLMTALGRQVVRRYYEWLLTGPHDMVALGAFQNQQLAGICFGGVFRGAFSGFLRRNRFFVAWRVASHPWVVLDREFRERLRVGFRLVLGRTARISRTGNPRTEPDRRTFGILVVAVNPHCQERGAGRALMSEAEGRARLAGYEQMYLTVHPGSARAIKFYEALGWVRVLQDGVWQGGMRKAVCPTASVSGTTSFAATRSSAASSLDLGTHR